MYLLNTTQYTDWRIGMSENFGYEPDEHGDLEFMTVRAEFIATNFAEYTMLFTKLVELAEPNVMPVLIFPEFWIPKGRSGNE